MNKTLKVGFSTVLRVVMCPFQDEFVELRALNRTVCISIANGEKVLAAGVGTIRVV